MEIVLDPSSVDDYRMFLQIKELPVYRFRGRLARFPDESVRLLKSSRTIKP